METLMNKFKGIKKTVPVEIMLHEKWQTFDRYDYKLIEPLLNEMCTKEYSDDDKLSFLKRMQELKKGEQIVGVTTTFPFIDGSGYSFLKNLKTEEAKNRAVQKCLMHKVVDIAGVIHQKSNDKDRLEEQEFLRICLKSGCIMKTIADVINVYLCGKPIKAYKQGRFNPLTIDENINEEQCMGILNVVKDFSNNDYLDAIKFQLINKLNNEDRIIEMCRYINFFNLNVFYNKEYASNTAEWITEFATEKLQNPDNIISLIRIISKQGTPNYYQGTFMGNAGITFAFDNKTDFEKIIEAINSMKPHSWKVAEVLYRLKKQTKQIEAANNKDAETKAEELERIEREAADIIVKCISYDDYKYEIAKEFKCKHSILTVIGEMTEEKYITKLLCGKPELFSDDEKFSIIQKHRFQEDESIIRILDTMKDMKVIREIIQLGWIKDSAKRLEVAIKKDPTTRDILCLVLPEACKIATRQDQLGTNPNNVDGNNKNDKANCRATFDNEYGEK